MTTHKQFELTTRGVCVPEGDQVSNTLMQAANVVVMGNRVLKNRHGVTGTIVPDTDTSHAARQRELRKAFLDGVAAHAYDATPFERDIPDVLGNSSFEDTHLPEAFEEIARRKYPILQSVPNYADIDTPLGRVIYTVDEATGKLKASNLSGNMCQILDTVDPLVLGVDGLRKIAELLANPFVERNLPE